jgi:cleavage stimulation factor subunit 3
VPNIRLWTTYLDYIRRRNDLTSDVTGQARRTVTQSYEFVIDNIGHDKDSGQIWQDYIQFIKSAPGNIGGSNWQDQQKMDQLRKAYQRAIAVPTSAVNTIWKEYDQFEMGLNKVTVSLSLEHADILVLAFTHTDPDNRAASSSRTARRPTCLPRVPASPSTT